VKCRVVHLQDTSLSVRQRSALAIITISFVSVCHSVILSATSGLNISETKPDSGIVPMDSLPEIANGLLIGHSPDDVT